MQRVVFYSGYQKRELICERKKTAKEGKGVRLMMDSAWNKAKASDIDLLGHESGKRAREMVSLFCFALLCSLMPHGHDQCTAQRRSCLLILG